MDILIKRLLLLNYGYGGAGITLSWGCANEVVKLLTPVVPKERFTYLRYRKVFACLAKKEDTMDLERKKGKEVCLKLMLSRKRS